VARLERTIQDQIGSHFDALSPQLKAAANYVVSHPHEIAMRSLRQIATTAALSPPTLTRLARAVGFESYEQLREICRHETTRRSRTFAEKARSLQQNQEGHEGRHAAGEPGGFLRRQAAAAINNIEAVVADLDLKRLAKAADMLASSERVFLVGSLSSAAFVDYAAYMAAMAFPNWHVLGRGGESIAAGLFDIGKRDAALVVTKSPYASRSIEAARGAAEAGAYVVAITDGIQSPVMRFADISLTVSTESPNFFSSYAATIVLIETLVGMVVRRSGKGTQERIAAVENANRAAGEYWQV